MSLVPFYSIKLLSSTTIRRPNNNLSVFTVDLPGELEFDDNTYMCVDEVSLAEPYPTVEDEFITFRDHDYSAHLKIGEIFDLTKFLRHCLYQTQVVSRYNDCYFADFLDPSITYSFSLQGENLPNLLKYRLVPSGNKYLKIPLDLSKFIFSSEIPSDFMHIFYSASGTSVWWPNIYIKIQKGVKYTMKQILYRFVETILAKTQLSFLATDVEYEKELEYLSNTENTIEGLHIEFQQRIARSSVLIKRFIDHFIEIVNSIRSEIEIERCIDGTDFIDRKYIFVYCGLVCDTGIQESRSCVLCVLPSESRKFIYIKNPNYIKVRDKRVQSMTIAILDERNKMFRFKPSIIPNYISIRFAKIFGG